jgi:hypothetical protein
MKRSIIRIVVLTAIGLSLFMGSGKLKNYPAVNSAAPDVSLAVDSSAQVFKTEHVWDAKVAIGDRISVGPSKNGERHIVPIKGGTFKGPKMQGEVLPLGEDWQLVRHDGDMELYARYLLKTNDGFLIQVINRALIHSPSGAKAPPYVRSVLDLEAPANSPYDYLNHAVFLGTLTMPQLQPGEKPYVIIGVNRVL